MKSVNIHEAKTHLSRLIEEAARGQPFVIAKAGKPMVKVVPIEPADNPRHQLIGSMKGEIVYSEEVDRDLDREIQRMFDDSLGLPAKP